jgi:integrase
MTTRRPNGAGTIYPRKDGRYEGAAWVQTLDGNRTRIRVYGRTWEETNKTLIKAVAEHQNGPGAPTDKRSLATYLEHWITTVAPHRVRPNTLANYRQAIEQHIIPALGNKKLAKLTAKDIRTWLDRIAGQCRCCTQHIDAKRTPDKQRCCATGDCCKLLPAPRRLQYYHGVLTSALAHAVGEDMIPRNVAKQVQTPTGPPRRYEPLTLTEAHAFLKETRRFHNGELYELALRTGMRRGELLGLRWSDIDFDFDNQRLTIRRTLQRIKGQGLVEMPTKTDTSDRRIPLSPPCIKILKDHLRYQHAERDRAADRWKDSGYVFTTSLGTPLDPQHVTQNIKTLCQRAGVRAIRFHDLRHTCATLLIETGVPLITVKELLGHANIAITANIYTHTRLPHQADALKQLDDQLDEPEHKARRRRTADTAPETENGVTTDWTEEPPPISTNHIS